MINDATGKNRKNIWLKKLQFDFLIFFETFLIRLISYEIKVCHYVIILGVLINYIFVIKNNNILNGCKLQKDS
jgi:hypothetical protein